LLSRREELDVSKDGVGLLLLGQEVRGLDGKGLVGIRVFLEKMFIYGG
jgi:hypothetical protein